MNKVIFWFFLIAAANLYTIVDASLPKYPVCGVHTGDRTKASIEFPWSAKIVYTKPGNKKGIHCSGTLISERYVLTSSHCVAKIRKTWTLSHVKLGGINSTDDNAVAQIIVHDKYIATSSNNLNDIALLKLEKDVQFNDKIQPICLPDADSASNVLEISEYGTTTTANRVEIYEVTKNDCKAYFIPHEIDISDSQLCAGAKKPRDTCIGNGGGALMKYGHSANSNIPHYMLVGISSFGPRECGTTDAPDVFTRVSSFMDWIVSNVN